MHEFRCVQDQLMKPTNDLKLKQTQAQARFQARISFFKQLMRQSKMPDKGDLNTSDLRTIGMQW